MGRMMTKRKKWRCLFGHNWRIVDVRDGATIEQRDDTGFRIVEEFYTARCPECGKVKVYRRERWRPREFWK